MKGEIGVILSVVATLLLVVGLLVGMVALGGIYQRWNATEWHKTCIALGQHYEPGVTECVK